MDGTVLIADDDRTIRTVLTQAFTRAGCKVHATASLMTLMRWVEEGKGDLVISDVVMPDGNGLKALPEIGKRRPDLPVVIISAQNTIMTAVQATEANAYDYLPKPFDLPDLMKRAAQALSKTPKPGAAPSVKEGDDLPLIGRTKAMQDLYALMARVMNTDLPVLITGESGTGKSRIAQALHDLSDRSDAGFAILTAADVAQPDQALGRAAGGTLLIDELGDFSADEQAHLVRLLDALGENAPRILATSKSEMVDALKDGSFREDLYYRLCGVALPVPPLRDRMDDIPLLAHHFLTQAERDGAPHRVLQDSAIELLRAYTWPGNVRQLENLIKRLVFTAPQEEVYREDVEQILGAQPSATPATAPQGETLSEDVTRHLRRYFDLHSRMLPPPGLYQRILKEVEAPLIEVALGATAGNQAKCADLLGINRNTLRKKITDLDIRVTRGRKLM